MRVTPAIVQHELIGLKARIVKSTNPSHIGMTGKVIDETRNTLVIRHGGTEKTITKNVAVFHFTMPDGTIIEINGNTILGRPEDRLKKRLRRRW